MKFSAVNSKYHISIKENCHLWGEYFKFETSFIEIGIHYTYV